MTYSGLNKEELRKEIKSKRDRLSTYEILKRSNEILAKLKELDDFINSKVIACYISFGSEVYTHGLIKEYVNKKDILVPVVDKKDKALLLSHLKDWKELDSGTYGILEPKNDFLRVRSYNEVELVIVPGIVFDEKGNRIGYGGGYYDRLLKRIDAKKIALAYDFQVMERIPNEEHDVRMDMIITEKRVIKCEI
ncbi:MAG TPA: 5-formyltetrahydrofolate cyclo-ligase [Thermoplasmatales archaeon]|nr:5-formyltetrahydrofolate cyclo-ligase [Thermoplasmatales archaeon]